MSDSFRPYQPPENGSSWWLEAETRAELDHLEQARIDLLRLETASLIGDNDSQDPRVWGMAEADAKRLQQHDPTFDERALEVAKYGAQYKIDIVGDKDNPETEERAEELWQKWLVDGPELIRMDVRDSYIVRSVENDNVDYSPIAKHILRTADIVEVPTVFNPSEYFEHMDEADKDRSLKSLLLVDTNILVGGSRHLTKKALEEVSALHAGDPELTEYRAGMLFKYRERFVNVYCSHLPKGKAYQFWEEQLRRNPTEIMQAAVDFVYENGAS